MAYDELNVKELSDTGTLSQEWKEYLSKLKKKVDNDKDNRIGWLRKLVTNNNQRIGLKRVSNRPYPGAPNIPLPETDKIINKQKPNYILSTYLPRKKAFVQVAEGVKETPQLKEKARKAELGLNYILNNKIDLLSIFALAADNFLEKGHCIFKVIERFSKKSIRKVLSLKDYPEETIDILRKASIAEQQQFVAERYGLDIEDEEDKEVIDDVVDQFRKKKDVIEFDLDVIESYPDILVRPPEKVTPPSWALDIETTERITDEYYLTRRELEEGAECGRYDKAVIDRLKDIDFSGKGKSMNEDDMIDTSKERNEGITSEGEDELFRIQEVSTWVKLDDMDKYERWVFLFLADVSAIEDSLIQKIRFQYELDTWNYVKHDNEVKDIRWHASRGIPEKIRALQEFMERSINNMIIRDEINNAPIYTVLANSAIQANSIRFIPGQKVSVKTHGEIARLDDLNRVDASSERMAQLLKAYVEEYVGSTDQLFRNATNKGGGKTKGEVQMGIEMASGPAQTEVIRWMNTLKKVYTMIFKLMAERLGDTIIIEGTEVTREDFNFDAVVIPNGSIDLTDQNIRITKAANHLQFVIQGPPEIVDADDKYNAAYDWLEAEGVQDPDRYITKPQIIAQKQQQQMQREDQVLQQQEIMMDKEIREKKAQAVASGQTQQAKPQRQMAGV
jgi:hypothetical protein